MDKQTIRKRNKERNNIMFESRNKNNKGSGDTKDCPIRQFSENANLSMFYEN